MLKKLSVKGALCMMLALMMLIPLAACKPARDEVAAVGPTTDVTDTAAAKDTAEPEKTEETPETTAAEATLEPTAEPAETFTVSRSTRPVYGVERSDKKIALTIDAAYEADKTEFILEQLAAHDVHATFFLCGFWLEKYPDQAKAIYDGGHEIGNHSSTHPHMKNLSAAEIRDEAGKTDDILESITGRRSHVFRVPYGEYNEQVMNTLHDMGYEVIQWTIDTLDWEEDRTAEAILDKVRSNLDSGSIILCHNDARTIREYLPKLLDYAEEQGYEFVTVSELLLRGDTEVDVYGIQKPVS